MSFLCGGQYVPVYAPARRQHEQKQRQQQARAAVPGLPCRPGKAPAPALAGAGSSAGSGAPSTAAWCRLAATCSSVRLSRTRASLICLSRASKCRRCSPLPPPSRPPAGAVCAGPGAPRPAFAACPRGLEPCSSASLARLDWVRLAASLMARPSPPRGWATRDGWKEHSCRERQAGANGMGAVGWDRAAPDPAACPMASNSWRAPTHHRGWPAGLRPQGRGCLAAGKGP